MELVNLLVENYAEKYSSPEDALLKQINKETYDFWRTMEFSYANIGNPFGSPTKVLSNISNGALGYFGGYAPQFRTIIIPR